VDGPEASDFQSKALQFATAYGLALQGLGLASIDANLVPTSVVRANVWRRKTPWVATAAVVALIAGGASFLRPMMDAQAVEAAQDSPEMRNVEAAKRQGRIQKDAWEEVAARGAIGYRAENVRRLLDRREIHQKLLDDVRAILTSGGAAPDASVEGSPDEWRGLSLHSMTTRYLTPSGESPEALWATPTGERATPETARGDSAATAAREGRGDRGGGARGGGAGTLLVTLELDATNSGQRAFIDATALQWLRENAERPDSPYTIEPVGVDEVAMETVKVGRVAAAEPEPEAEQAEPATRDGAARRDDRRDDRRADRRGSRRDEGRTPASGAASVTRESGALREIAPLPDLGGPFPPEATVHRYTITFEARLKGPAETRFDLTSGETPATARAEDVNR
jgi:hypothetical protein